MRNNLRIVILLVVLLILTWLFFDFTLRDKAQYLLDFEYSFKSKTLAQVKEFADEELDEYQLSEGSYEQVRFLVNALECHHYLLYANKISVTRFYDFIRLVLFPSQRAELKDKEKYVYEIKRYLRRKRNLDIQYSGYEVSEPVIPENTKDGFVRVYLTRKNAEGKEYLSYSFKTFKNRYYLYFETAQAGTDFILIKK